MFVREWALERWGEGTQVSLANELHILKAEIRLMQEANANDDDEEDIC
jgi:hypothetical protein